MSTVRTNAAAEMLGVSPNTLRSWERRFGYPKPKRTQGGHRQFEMGEIESLRQAFAETHNISSAISLARERGEGPSTAARMQTALAGFDEDKAGRLLEESLAVRSVERTVEEVLLPAVQGLEGPDLATPELQFAWRFSTGWLAAAQRVAPPAHRKEGVLVFEAARLYDLDSLHAQALELTLRRGGFRTLTLSVEIDPTRLARALRALAPRAVVLTGHRASMDTLGRLVYAVRNGGEHVLIFDYRGALPNTGASTVPRLGDAPLEARDALLDVLSRPAKTAPERPADEEVPARRAVGHS
jgi:MerR family transcriptional regulator, light-induced transcriptional regulator